jgi:steroid 5-alpha reductase family enzyme
MNDLTDALWLTAVVTVCYQLFFFFIAAYFKFDKVTDFAGGSNFVILAFLVLFLFSDSNEFSDRKVANTVLVAAWGLRLSCFLLYRVVVFESDSRFDGTRENCCKFLGFWVFQMMWVWTVSLPLTYVNSVDVSRPIVAADIVGFTMAILGLLCETVADNSKLTFKLDAANKGKWCAAGIWKYSKHPNYFGELLFWWGVFVSCSASFAGRSSVGYFTIISPLFITYLLLGLSGIPILERSGWERFSGNAEYVHYVRNTSMLIPLPVGVYTRLPQLVKTCLLFDWPLYGGPSATEKHNGSTLVVRMNEDGSA